MARRSGAIDLPPGPPRSQRQISRGRLRRVGLVSALAVFLALGVTAAYRAYEPVHSVS